MPLKFFGSLSKKGPSYDLNTTASPPHQTNVATHSLGARLPRGLRASTSWYTPKPVRQMDRERGNTGNSRWCIEAPLMPDDTSDIRLSRPSVRQKQSDERQFQSSTLMYDDELYDVEQERAGHQAKMDRIDMWRRGAHGSPEPTYEGHKWGVDDSRSGPQKLDPPVQVNNWQQYDQLNGRGRGSRGSSREAFNAPSQNGLRGKRKITPQEVVDSAARSPYGSSGHKAKSKSTPFLLETGPRATADTAHLIYPEHIQRMYCYKCRALPLAGTTCVHGVPGTVVLR